MLVASEVAVVDVGEKVIQKNNPYLPMQPYSAFPGFIYRVIDFFSFGMNSPIIFILLNLIGIYSLINFLLPYFICLIFFGSFTKDISTFS